MSGPILGRTVSERLDERVLRIVRRDQPVRGCDVADALYGPGRHESRYSAVVRMLRRLLASGRLVRTGDRYSVAPAHSTPAVSP